MAMFGMHYYPLDQNEVCHYIPTDNTLIDPTCTISFRSSGKIISSASLLTTDYLSKYFTPKSKNVNGYYLYTSQMFEDKLLPSVPYSSLEVDFYSNRFIGDELVVNSERVDKFSIKRKQNGIVCRPIPITVTKENNMFIRDILPANYIGMIVWSNQALGLTTMTSSVNMFLTSIDMDGFLFLNGGKTIEECLHKYLNTPETRDKVSVDISLGQKDSNNSIVADMLLCDTFEIRGGMLCTSLSV